MIGIGARVADRSGRRAAMLLAVAPFFAPTARAADQGTIAGTVQDPSAVASISAIERATDKSYPGTFDAKTGAFAIEGLRRGRRYDVRIDYRDGARLEGIDLNVPRSDYEEEQPLSPEDVATIKRQVRALNQFEDEVEVLAVSGNIQHAAVLINKLRTRPFVNAKPGEVVWRAELWHFERPEETWVKSQDELFLVLYRRRIPKDEYAKISIVFDATLGGLAFADERPVIRLGTIARPSAAPGVRLRGIPEKPRPPATR